MSAFRDAFRAASPKLDATFGERLEIRRAMPGEFVRAVAYSSDPPEIVVGILDMPTEILRPKGTNDAARTEVAASHPVADFAESLFAGVLAPPAKGDEIVALDRAGEPRFRVLDARPDGLSRLICQLSPLQ